MPIANTIGWVQLRFAASYCWPHLLQVKRPAMIHSAQYSTNMNGIALHRGLAGTLLDGEGRHM